VSGEKLSQADWLNSSETGAKVPARQNSQVPLARSRVSNANEELATRDD